MEHDVPVFLLPPFINRGKIKESVEYKKEEYRIRRRGE